MKKGFLKTAFSVMLLGSVVALTSCHESASVNVVVPSGPVAPVTVAAPTTVVVAPVSMTGAPIPGASVTLTINGVSATAVADATGNCTFDNLLISANSPFTVTVTMAGYNPAQAEGSVDKGEIAYVPVYLIKDEATLIAEGNAAEVTPADAAAGDVTESFNTETTLPLDDPDNVNTVIPVNVLVPSQFLEDKVIFVPFYDPDLAVSDMLSRAEADYLYCGIRAYLSNGLDIKSGKTLTSDITIDFAVDENLKSALHVRKLNTSGEWIAVPNVDMTTPGIVKITDKDLTYYGLFFTVAKTEVSSSSTPFSIADYVVGPFVSKSFPYTVASGAKLNGTTGSVFGIAFLKTLMTRDLGRVGRDFTNRRATYNYSYPVYANQYLKVTGEQAFKQWKYAGAGATVTATGSGNVTITPVVYTIQTDVHSGGLVDGE